MSLLGSATSALRLLREQGVSGCLVGGLAVSARCDPRFTRDVDLAVAVSDDRSAEAAVQALQHRGYSVSAVVEQEAVGRLAMVRVVDSDGVSVDLLVASSGIESEVVAESELLEVTRGVRLPVARTGHLIALKLLSVAPGRETDVADLRGLASVADVAEWLRAETAVRSIVSRGFTRGRDLVADLASLRGSAD
ncbi:MAG: nucleotidyltransferase [Ilumatobacteraceae bacterium]